MLGFLKLLLKFISSHAEILLWPWVGPHRKPQIKDKTHGPTGARSRCSGTDQSVIGTGNRESSDPTWP